VSAGHYENFPVATLLVPARLRRATLAIYRFARAADDLADEGNALPAERLRALAAFDAALDAIDGGDTPPLPPFPELARAVREHDLPVPLLRDLLSAFAQDVTIGRYRTFDELLDYCRRSANPVGRLLLALYRVDDSASARQSDAICTALQLANFWQDVTLDLEKGRIYIPLEVMRRHGYSESDLVARQFTPSFQAVMREIVNHARDLFLQGQPLSQMVDRRLSLDIDLFHRGGMRVLQKIEQCGYNVLAARPAISKMERAGLLLAAIVRAATRRAA